MGQRSHTKEREDPLKALADKLRAKGGVEWRQAISADQRVEYIRGKDFMSYFKSNPDEVHSWAQKGLKLEDRIKALAEIMMKRRLFVKSDRMFKKPKPGKKRLAKWPKKLMPLYADQNFDEEYFYAWQYDRPSSPWLFVFSVLLVIVVILFCLFPLAPQPLKLAVVYASMALLILIFGILIVRSIVATVSWLAFGRPLWLFPYLLSEDKGLDEAFWPIFQLEDAPTDKKWMRLLLRFGVGASLALLSFALYHHAPDKGAALGGAKQAHDAILDMFNLHDRGPSLTFQGQNSANTSENEQQTTSPEPGESEL